MANEDSVRDLMAVFSAACVDLGISCKPDALRLFFRRKLKPFESAPPLKA